MDGKYIGHQFTGTLIRQENAKEVTKTFVGFTRVAENINDLSKSGERVMRTTQVQARAIILILTLKPASVPQ
ncbi:hypothetical protein BSPWISOXPB_6038 [uncultured Gammaproteobacteria bacterium]|nr:hypothetical protein BSPWISOXPB_6038 [uncultured Gammaproteobacteria bacterium]